MANALSKNLNEYSFTTNWKNTAKGFLKNDAKSGQNENIYLKQLIDYAV